MRIPIFLKISLMIMACASITAPAIPSAQGATTTVTSPQQKRKTTTTANKQTPKKTAAKTRTKATPKPVEVVAVDTIEAGDFMRYKKNTPVGKLISEYGATEISQRHKPKGTVDYSSIMLPARIARVAKGEHPRQVKKVQSILADDMIGYFELAPRLSTPLKRKAFSSDPSYQWFVDEFEAVKNQLYKHIFFVAMPIDSEFDIDTGTFTVPLPYARDTSVSRSYTDQLAEDIYLSPFDLDLTDSKITIPLDEKTALKVEGEGCSLILMGRLSPQLQSISFRDFTAENAIIFNPVGQYIVRNSDGAIIATLKDAAVGIELLEHDGEGDLIIDDDEWNVSSDPNDYDYIYEGRIGNNPIMLCYLMDMDAEDGVEVLGFYKNTKTDETFTFNGIRKNSGNFTLNGLNQDEELIGDFILETSSDQSLHGTFKDTTNGDVSEVHLRLKKAPSE